MARTILVTGGAGFIGCNLVHRLIERFPKDRIIVLDLLTYAASARSLPDGFRFMEESQWTLWHGDIRHPTLVQALIDQSDIVIHLAAETHVTRSIFDNHTFIDTDIIGTHTLLSAMLNRLKQLQRFIHISTSEVYGNSRDDRMTEDHPLNPQSPYAAAKCAADRLVYSYIHTYNLPTVIVRPFNNFGPRQHLEKLVPRFITSSILEEPMTIHGDGNSARDFVFVEDTCDAIMMVMEAPADLVLGETFNIASGHARSVNEIADDVTRLSGLADLRRSFVEQRPGQVARHRGSWTKINERLGWTPTVDWDTGLQRTFEWYRTNQDWWTPQLAFRSIPIMTLNGVMSRH